jgi:hypothetical protein
MREPAYQYTPAIAVADWRQERVTDVYGRVAYHLLIEVTDNKIPVGTIDVVLNTCARNNIYVIR